MAGYISDAVIRRMPAYYRYLRELEAEGVLQISSQELGERMQLTPSQIRQDINSFGGFGRQGYGYPVTALKNHIRETMGLNREHRMVIVGAGRMGLAVANYAGFVREGFITEALFDIAPERIRADMIPEQLPIYPAEEMKVRIPELKPDIVVLAVPQEAAQETLERVYALGVRAVWNFAPVDLHYPRDMTVMNLHLSDSLTILSYHMRQMELENGKK